VFKLLASAFKRLTTAMTAPFQALWVKIQRMFNVNVITAKLIAPLTKKIKSLIVLRPDSWKDYYKFGRIYVYKKLFLLLIVCLCAVVFIVCRNYLPAVEPVETAEAVVTDVPMTTTTWICRASPARPISARRTAGSALPATSRTVPRPGTASSTTASQARL
jgi:hypothetical protein